MFSEREYIPNDRPKMLALVVVFRQVEPLSSVHGIPTIEKLRGAARGLVCFALSGLADDMLYFALLRLENVEQRLDIDNLTAYVMTHAVLTPVFHSIHQNEQ